MANKKKKNDRRAFKKTGEELQQWLIFTRRGSKVESGKKYNRQKFKRGDKEWKQHNRLPKSGKHRWMTTALSAQDAEVPPKWNGYTRTATPTGNRRKMFTNVGAVSGLKSSSTWLATTYWKTRDKTPRFFFWIFGRAATIVMAANFYYTIPQPICQEKSWKKIK